MKRTIFVISIFFVLSAAAILIYANKMVYGEAPCSQEETTIYIATGSDFEQVYKQLEATELVCHESLFRKMAEMKNYTAHVKPGKYVFQAGMSYNDLLDQLRIGATTPVKLRFNYAESLADLAGRVSKQIEADSVSLYKAMSDLSFWESHRLDKHTAKGFFIPNTYEFHWHSSAEDFILRMEKEYKRFWNLDRLNKAKKLHLSPLEISTMASIVQKETAKGDEMPVVAGLYLNRIRKRMKLESDPTVIYALKQKQPNAVIRRVLKEDLKINSPFNTYKVKGIPPGPICIPSIQAIDAVLEDRRHDYIFMCAKEDFSGYHNFAKTLRQHRKNAKKYHQALNRRKVLR